MVNGVAYGRTAASGFCVSVDRVTFLGKWFL